MLDDLRPAATSRRKLVLEVLEDLRASAGVDKTQSVEGASLGVRARPRYRGAVAREVRPEDRHPASEVALVEDTERGGSREFGPVGRPAEPVEVRSEERVRGCSSVHERVRKSDGRVVHRGARLEGFLSVLEDEEVRVVVLEEEVKVQPDRLLAGKDRSEVRHDDVLRALRDGPADLGEVLLGRALGEVKANLVRDEHAPLGVLGRLGRGRGKELFEERRRERRLVELDVNLGDGKVVRGGGLEEEAEEEVKDLRRDGVSSSSAKEGRGERRKGRERRETR